MKKNFQIILIAFFSGLLGAYTFYGLQPFLNPSERDNRILPEKGQIEFTKRERNSLISAEVDFVQASAISTKSVVYIKTISDSKYDSFNMFDFLFGEGQGNRKISGSGSGVIFTADGYIVTNYHVIEDAEKIEVIHQKKSYEAKIVGTDPSADLAIIKINAKNMPNIKLGSSKTLQVGEWVLAVGNPFNLTSTVTAGIVSAKGRDIQLISGQFPLESFIQTDAAINPGNSGGALVNIKGELVGINTAILSRTGYYTGYGFAVPADIVAKIFNDLIQYGEVQKAFTGVSVSDLNTDIADRFKINTDNFDGALVVEVQKGSEAEKLGIREGDIILKVNNESVTSKNSFDEQVSYYRPGDKIKLTYRRETQNKESQITLTNREGTTGILKSKVLYSEIIGADLETVSKIEKDKLGISEGVRVVKVKRGLFSRLGIQEGFVITSINRQAVKNPEDVDKILSNIGGKVYIEGINKNGVRGYYSFYF